MATISAAAAIARPSVRYFSSPEPSFCRCKAGLPQLTRARAESVRCGYSKAGGKVAPAAALKGAPSMLAAAMTVSSAPAAMALVDERMSTEGTGSAGAEQQPAGWVLLGMFGLVWSLYTVYTSTLDEDEDSGGLSL
uniref:PSII 6.1 kDa protein n=1 Tax=Oryza brachyantha TaxID=4533 RepID=J3M8Q8_ORYBR